jgi:hypothetical protein
MRKSLFNYFSIDILKLENFRVLQIYPLKRNLVPRFAKASRKIGLLSYHLIVWCDTSGSTKFFGMIGQTGWDTS